MKHTLHYRTTSKEWLKFYTVLNNTIDAWDCTMEKEEGYYGDSWNHTTTIYTINLTHYEDKLLTKLIASSFKEFQEVVYDKKALAFTSV